MIRRGAHGRATVTAMDGIRPASLLRGLVLAVLRDAGEDGVDDESLRAAFGDAVHGVIDDLRSRGHCIQVQNGSPRRVILHETTQRRAA